MATYKIRYACGHGEGKVEVTGTSQERKWKLAWYEENLLCPECYRASKKNESYEAELINNYFAGGEAWIVLTHGDTYAIKENLKKNGFFWITYCSDFFGANPKKGWGIPVPENQNDLVKICEFLKELGIQELKINVKPIPKFLQNAEDEDEE